MPLVVIEVQSGEYLGDDDIVRIDSALLTELQHQQGMLQDSGTHQEGGEAEAAAYAPSAAPISPGGTVTVPPSALARSSSTSTRQLKPSAAMAALAAAQTVQQQMWPSDALEPPTPPPPPPPPLAHLLGAAAIGAALVLLGASFKKN